MNKTDSVGAGARAELGRGAGGRQRSGAGCGGARSVVAAAVGLALRLAGWLVGRRRAGVGPADGWAQQH